MNDIMELVVSRVTDEAEAIRSFEFERADGGPLPSFTAGAHIDVHTPSGLLRQYSLLNDDREDHRYVIAVLRDDGGRGGSKAMHEMVEAGTRLKVGSPRNAFPIDEAHAPVVLVAGGIGITPLLAMARNLHANARPFELHFATRSLARTPFVSELSQAPFADSVYFYRDDGPATQRFDIGNLTANLAPGTHVYLCGPGGFMDAVATSVRGRGDVVLHTEYFAAPQQAPVEGEAFKLILARSAIETIVPSGKSIIEILDHLGVQCTLNCEQGICGTCLTSVLSGEVDHRDHYLSAGDKALGDRMLICVSRGKAGSELVIDL
jgi:vanillate O-demethylase ferredoxin subunit